MARVGGVILALLGLFMMYAGGGLALAMLGRPLPDVPLLRDLAPYLQKVAEEAALPPGSDWGALMGSSIGIIALAGFGAGLVIVLAGAMQVVSGRRSGATLVLVAAAMCGFAVAAAMA